MHIITLERPCLTGDDRTAQVVDPKRHPFSDGAMFWFLCYWCGDKISHTLLRAGKSYYINMFDEWLHSHTKKVFFFIQKVYLRLVINFVLYLKYLIPLYYMSEIIIYLFFC